MNMADPESLPPGVCGVGWNDPIRERLDGPAFVAGEEHPGARQGSRWRIAGVWRPG